VGTASFGLAQDRRRRGSVRDASPSSSQLVILSNPRPGAAHSEMTEIGKVSDRRRKGLGRRPSSIKESNDH
jgi:hypothetical protein